MTYQPELAYSSLDSIAIGGIMWMTTNNLNDHDNDESEYPQFQSGTIEFTSSVTTQIVEISGDGYFTNYDITLSPSLGAITLKTPTSFTVEASGGFTGFINWQTIGGNTPHLNENWLLCDGRSLSVNEYNKLFSTIGYTFGGSGNNFNIPNLIGRYIVGQKIEEGLNIGNYGGEHEHQLTANELPEHRHFFRDYYIGYRDIRPIEAALAISTSTSTFFSSYLLQKPDWYDQIYKDCFGNNLRGNGPAMGYRLDNDNRPNSSFWNRTAGKNGTPWRENLSSNRYNQHDLVDQSGPWGAPPFGGKGGGNDEPHYNIAPYLALNALIRYK